MNAISVASPTRSLSVPDGSGLPRSEPDAAPPSTPIANASQRDYETQLKVLIALFKGLLAHTFSEDAVALAVYRACDTLAGDMDREQVKVICADLLRAARRPRHPIDSLFRRSEDPTDARRLLS